MSQRMKRKDLRQASGLDLVLTDVETALGTVVRMQNPEAEITRISIDLVDTSTGKSEHGVLNISERTCKIPMERVAPRVVHALKKALLEVQKSTTYELEALGVDTHDEP